MDKRQKILIVDDAGFNRDILKEILGETYSYLESENGNQAIRIMEENPEIDLMMLDINMPQMNGFEVLELMNRFQWIDETPVIMISSEESVDTMRKAYEMGITDYITRPFDSIIVKKRVQNTLALYAKQKRLVDMVVDQVYEKEENIIYLFFLLFFPSPMFHKATMYLNTITWYSYPAKIYTTWKNIYNTVHRLKAMPFSS